MILFDGGVALLFTALWLFCLIDVITTPDGATRNLPKIAWILLVIVLFDLGAIAWLVAGRPWQGVGTRPDSLPYKGNRDVATRYPEYDRPGRFAATNPDDDEQFLAGLRARAEEQRRRADEGARRRAEQDGA